MECRVPFGHSSWVCRPRLVQVRGRVPKQRVLRVCSRPGALLWRDMADPTPVSCKVSPMVRGQPDRLECATPSSARRGLPPG